MAEEHVLQQMMRRYPQLCLPIDETTEKSGLYRDVVLKGIISEHPYMDFLMDARDMIENVDCAFGKIEILTLYDRRDFEHCVQSLVHKCNPVVIPTTMGAVTIIGLNNWEKIRNHQEDFLKRGDANCWASEFNRFIKCKGRYKDTVIILSAGYYSGIFPEEVGISEEEWLNLSLIIRKYHEVTHVISRHDYPDNIRTVRDEVVADMIGMTIALGKFNPALEKKILGINDDIHNLQGRLVNYVDDELSINKAVEEASYWINYLSKVKHNTNNPVELISEILKSCMAVSY